MSFRNTSNYIVNSVKDLLDDKMRSDIIDDTIHYLSPASAISLDDEILPPTNVLPVPRQSSQNEYEFIGESLSADSAKSLKYSKILKLERTLAIIKPDAVKYEEVVERKLKEHGFHILQKRRLQLTPEQVSDLYFQHYGKMSFPYLVIHMSSAPVIVMCLAAIDAVAKLKKLVKGDGTIHYTWFWPKSISSKFGYMESMDNMLCVSEDVQNAHREIRFFFPQMILEPLLKTENQITDFLSLYVNSTLINGLTEVCKKKPVEPILFLAEWLMLNNPNQPKMKPEIAKLPT